MKTTPATGPCQHRKTHVEEDDTFEEFFGKLLLTRAVDHVVCEQCDRTVTSAVRAPSDRPR
jgi:hypothetical protein